MVVCGEKRKDAVAGRDPRGDEEGDGRGDERGGGAMERARLPAAAPEGDEAGIIRRRRDPRLDRRAAVVDEHAVEVDHPVRNARPVGEEEP